MTTPEDRLAIDLIFAALGSVGLDDAPHDATIKQLTMLSGLWVHLCHEHGIAKALADQLMSERWQQYKERFPYDA